MGKEAKEKEAKNCLLFLAGLVFGAYLHFLENNLSVGKNQRKCFSDLRKAYEQLSIELKSKAIKYSTEYYKDFKKMPRRDLKYQLC